MKIAVVASPVTPLQPAQMGGAQSVVSDLASGLSRRGHDVWLYCAAGSDVPGVRLVTVPPPKDAASALVMPGGPPPVPAPGVTAAIKSVFDLISANSYDVVTQHAFDAPAFAFADGLPVLHTLHLPPLVPAVVEAAGKVHSSKLATVSRSCQQAWLRAGVAVGRMLPNGVEDFEIAEQSPDRYALIAGRISPEKGIEHALAAAARVGLPVRVAGGLYDPSYVVDFSTARVLGILTRLELRRVMARSLVTICAAHWDEPFGLVAAEAQMAGCPVAAYRRGALPEVIDDGVSGAPCRAGRHRFTCRSNPRLPVAGSGRSKVQRAAAAQPGGGSSPLRERTIRGRQMARSAVTTGGSCGIGRPRRTGHATGGDVEDRLAIKWHP